MDEIERRTVSKLTRRLVPLLVACYFVAILDRGNVAVAALTMNQDLGLSATAFGLAAGIFFLPYFLFELPSNLALQRFGARLWIARIMITWGIISGLNAFVWNANSYYVVRALLGAAEAGFFPGIIFYVTLWFPAAYRGRIVGWFMTGIPIALVIGTPISSMILGLDGLFGLRGWQVMFLVEAVPAVLLGCAVPFVLPSRPEDARFLTGAERDWLTGQLARETRARGAEHKSGLIATLLSPRVLLLALAYYGLTGLNSGVATFLPLILKGLGMSNVQSGFVAAIPYAFGALGMVGLGFMADRAGMRKAANLTALAISACGLVLASTTDSPVLKLVFLCFAALGLFGCMPVFWGLPTGFLSASTAAGGIALINALGNLSGFVNPYAMGAIRDATGSFNGGLLWLAVMAAMSFTILFIVIRQPALEGLPAAA